MAERFDGAYPRRIIAKELGGTGPSFDGYRLAAYSSATQGTHTLYYDAVKVGATRAEIEP